MFKKVFSLLIITLMLFSCFSIVNAGTGNVVVKDHRIHMDADNIQTGFVWTYLIDFETAPSIDSRFLLQGFECGCTHDRYFYLNDLNGKMNLTIKTVGIAKDYYLHLNEFDEQTCGFKVYGGCEDPHVNYNFYKNGVHYTGQLKFNEFNKKFKGD